MKAQAWTLIALLAVTAAAVEVRGDVDKVPASSPLTAMPSTIGSWSGRDTAISPAVLHALGNGYFLSRSYSLESYPGGEQARTSASMAPPVDLFIGYYPTQRSGQAIHSPLICLPGAGWVFDSSGTTSLTRPNGSSYRVAEYLISNGLQRVEVLYWYKSQGRSIANDYEARWYTLLDSMRSGRTDAALVRLTTSLHPGESQREAHDRAVSFATEVAPLLPEYIPD